MVRQLTPPLRPKPQSGAALIITLTLLLLITGLAISLFMTANTELQSASQFKNSQGLTELSDICVNLVMGQIKDATTTGATGEPATRSTWASQPGMIRTYGSSTNAAMSYKLYSWSDPRVSGDDTTSVPTTWFSTPAIYTDLNAPIPNSTNSTNTDLYRYPIAYPTGSTAALGYTVSGAPVGAVSGEAFTNSVPMPVQWLYVLKDGTMVYATSASGNNATISAASAANPIVARVAYWTDDETSKVNINTAAGGEYWATPVQRTDLQYTNSVWQPTRWEFQRYPGHPARTDLQAVFPDLTRQQIWAFTPRVSNNGATAASAVAANQAGNQPSTSVAYDSDRLLASVGEARFSSTNTNAGGRADFTNNWSGRIEANKFLITASSRAPETTLYGTPRISIWPIPTNTSTNFRTTLDSLFAFCSTIQNTTTINTPRPYYFVHSTATNVAGDVANTINTAMFTYLDSLSGCSTIPGIGSESLVNKYTANGRDQLVTQFYDYIRCVNKLDTQVTSGNRFAANLIVPPTMRISSGGNTTYGFGRFPTINQVAVHFICTADGANAASANGTTNLSLKPDTTSNGTDLAANQVCVQAVAYIEPAMPACSYPDVNYNSMNFTVSGLNQLTLNGQSLNFTNSAVIKTRPSDIAGTWNLNTGFGGGVLKYLAFLVNGNAPGTTIAPQGRAGFSGGSYPLVSDPIRITNAATMTLGAANVTVGISWPNSATTPAHTVTIPFPTTNIPTPTLSATTPKDWAFSPNGWNGLGNGTGGRFPTNNAGSWETSSLFRTNDTVFAMATAHADYRINMVRPGVATNWSAVPASTNVGYGNFQHRLFNGSGGNWVPGANYPTNALGLLPANSGALRPPIPTQATLTGLGFAHPLTYGDFDNSLPTIPDGAYINATDEMGGWGTGANQGLYWANVGYSGGNYTTTNFHTPNRKIASPIAFGSLPTAAVQDRPWQNLLFRPAPGVNHPGKAGLRIDGTSLSGAAPDHVWLDFFWMPIVEPWAISETFSTAGKINMNYQIAPFSYIRRTTGVQAVLKSGGVTAVSSIPGGYTTSAYDKTTSGRSRDNSPFPVNMTETLKGFDARLTNNAALFRTASEICELPIVPVASGATYNSLQDGSWWNNWQYTGDNTKEATYNDIYPRLTTKSNTYTVHYRVQMLKKLPGGDQSTWDESKDKVASELRGSTLIERFLDPNATYPDYATAFSTSASLETLYRFRVLQRSQFTP